MIRHAKIAAAAAAGTLVPTLLVIAWYLLAGQWDGWVGANINATISLVGGDAPPLDLWGLEFGVRGFCLLFLGTAATIVGAPFLARTQETKRGLFAILCWLTAMALSLLFLRRFANHFFLQALPVLSLTTAFGLALLTRRVFTARWEPAVLFTCLALIAIWCGWPQFSIARETLSRRQIDGIAHWGDRSATVAAAIKDRLTGPEDVYVFAWMIGIYQATGAKPPTRFPFYEHLYAGYAPVDGMAEMQRILNKAPRFIVVDDRFLQEEKSDGITETVPRKHAVLSTLRASLERDYVVDGRVGTFKSGGGGEIGGNLPITVFRRRDVPAMRATQALHYDAVR